MAKNEAARRRRARSGKKAPGKRKKKTFKKRGEKRVVHHGFAHIQASFNNTLVTITDAEGNVVAWSSAGGIGFTGLDDGVRARRRDGIAAGIRPKVSRMSARSRRRRLEPPRPL